MTVTPVTTVTTNQTNVQANSVMKTGLLLLQAAIVTVVVSVFVSTDAPASVQPGSDDRSSQVNATLTQNAF
jgi:hypothetical protein